MVGRTGIRKEEILRQSAQHENNSGEDTYGTSGRYSDEDDSYRSSGRYGNGDSYGKSGGYSGIGVKSSYQNKNFGSDNGASQLSNSYKIKAKPAPKKPRAVPQSKPYIATAAKTHVKGSLAGISKGMPMKTAKPEYETGDRVSHIKYGIGTVDTCQRSRATPARSSA